MPEGYEDGRDDSWEETQNAALKKAAWKNKWFFIIAVIVVSLITLTSVAFVVVDSNPKWFTEGTSRFVQDKNGDYHMETTYDLYVFTSVVKGPTYRGVTSDDCTMCHNECNE